MGIVFFLGGFFAKWHTRHTQNAPEEWEEWVEDVPIEQGEEHTDSASPSREREEWIYVDIKGEVHMPGVYQIEAEKRVVDVLELAGGITEKANPNKINLALKLTDQMVVLVPHIDEEHTEEWGDVSPEKESEKVNLNTADATHLMTLDGIGPKKADAILQYREEHGSFQLIEDIKKVSGIGEKTFERLKEHIETGH